MRGFPSKTTFVTHHITPPFAPYTKIGVKRRPDSSKKLNDEISCTIVKRTCKPAGFHLLLGQVFDNSTKSSQYIKVQLNYSMHQSSINIQVSKEYFRYIYLYIYLSHFLLQKAFAITHNYRVRA